MKHIKTEIDGIVRDVETGALLNRDNTSLDAYKKSKKRNQEMEDLKNKVNSFVGELTEIKTLLSQLIEKTK